MSADLAADTAVRADPDHPHRYHLTLPDHWDYLMPSGGVVMTCALRAAEAALGSPVHRLASATTIFCAPLRSGPLVADVAVLRRGGSTAQVRVALRNVPAENKPAPGEGGEAGSGAADDAGLELLVTFCRDRKGPDVIGAAFPSTVRPLADAPDALDDSANNPHTRLRFYHQLDCRIADGDRWWAGGLAAGPARYARWLRYKVPQRDAEGRLDRLALPPLIDTMPTALHRAIGPGGYRFYAPSLDLTTHVVDDTRREWLLVAATVRRARAGWAIAEAEVWDDEGRFLAFGTQAMYLHGLSGEPPIIDASGR
ncbi:MAG: thioesterase family protein [Deltaproteobacteria bacterium]|nr:thioesterase family protein [Deltaproteobacteria bacterium]